MEIQKKNKYEQEKEQLKRLILDNRALHPLESIKYARQLFELAESRGDLLVMGYAHFCIGNACYYLSDFEKYLEHSLRALEFYQKINSKKNIADAFNGIGIAYMELLKYSEAHDYLLRALTIREKLGDRNGMSSSFQNIGLILSRLNRHENALEYLFKALKINEETDHSRKIALTLNNIGSTYYDLGELEKAIVIFERSYAINAEENNKISMAATLLNLASCYKSLKKYDMALDHLFKTLKIYEETSSRFKLTNVLFEAARIYLEIGNEEQGLVYLQKSRERALEDNSPKILKEIFLTYADYYASKGDFEYAYTYHVKYAEIRDELNTAEINKKILEIQVKFDVERKEKETELAKAQAELYRAQNVELSELVKEKTQKIIEMEKFYEVGKFSASIVHNLNNPLTSLIGGIELLKVHMGKEISQSKDIMRYFRITEESSDNIRRMIRSITSNVRSGKYERDVELDLNEIILRALEFSKFDKDLTDKLIFETDLVEEINLLSGQEVHFYQIFSNLFKNAIDALQDTEDKKLSVTTRNLSRFAISISIEDSGHGIKREDLGKLFSTEYTTKAPGKGTGLGLPITKQMVESYQGTIEVTSEVGKGAVFMMTLPTKRSIR